MTNLTYSPHMVLFAYLLILKWFAFSLLYCFHCSKNGCVEGIIQRLKTYKDPDLKFEIKVYLTLVTVSKILMLFMTTFSVSF